MQNMAESSVAWKPLNSIEPFLDETVLITDYTGEQDSLDYEKLCHLYNTVLEELHYYKAVASRLNTKCSVLSSRCDDLETALSDYNDE